MAFLGYSCGISGTASGAVPEPAELSKKATKFLRASGSRVRAWFGVWGLGLKEYGLRRCLQFAAQGLQAAPGLRPRHLGLGHIACRA